MRTPDMFFAGVGVYLPDQVSVEWAVERGLYPADEIDVHELTGAAVAGDTPAPEMALRAAQAAVSRCGQRPPLDLLLYTGTWHQGPQGWLPASYLQRHLVGDEVPAVEIRQGCCGMFSAFDLASSYLQAFPDRRAALLVAADNYGTPLLDRWRMGHGHIAGDAASAVVLTKERGFAQLLSVCTASFSAAEEMHRGGEQLFPPGATVARPLNFSARGNEFRRQVLGSTAGTALIKIQKLRMQTITQCLDESGIEIADITRVAFMNYGREIVEQGCMAALGLPMSKSTWEFGRGIGHCGASDQIIAMDHLLATGGLNPGDHVLMLATGPGITVASAIVKIIDLPSWAE